MATEQWSYKWHYFSAITALLTCECGYYGLFDELKKAFDEDKAHTIRLLPSDSPASGGDAPLIHLIRSLVDRYMSGRGDPYDASWGNVPWKLDVKLRKMPPALTGEILVTPSALIVPWPFPTRDDEHKEFMKTVDHYFGTQGHKIPNLNDTAGEYKGARDLRLQSVFSVVDVLITEKEIPEPCSDRYRLFPPAVRRAKVQAKKTLLRSRTTSEQRHKVIEEFENSDFPTRFKEWSSFSLPTTLDIHVHETWRTTETRLVAVGEKDAAHLELHLGVDVHNTLDARYQPDGRRRVSSAQGGGDDSDGLRHVSGAQGAGDISRRQFENPHAYGALGDCIEHSLAPRHLSTPSDKPDPKRRRS